MARDFGDAWVVDCPDASVVGKSIADVARERNQHEVDTFLDLIIDHGRGLRWRTVIANHRDEIVRKNIAEPCALIGFSDAGAHLRNMAFYNFPLHVLQHSLQANPALTPEKAVWRCSGEIAEWFGIEAGTLRVGDRADMVIIDPIALQKADLEVYAEASFDELGGLQRMVNRNDDVVKATIINGQLAWDGSQYHSELGKRTGFGRFLPRTQHAQVVIVYVQRPPVTIPRVAPRLSAGKAPLLGCLTPRSVVKTGGLYRHSVKAIAKQAGFPKGQF